MHSSIRGKHSRKIILIAKRKCKQLAELLEDLLKISDVSTKHVLLTKHEPVPLSEIIEKAIASKEPQELGAKKFVLLNNSFEKDGYKFYLQSKRELLEQALVNLLENAILYGKNGGKVILKTKFVRPHIVISVIDKGQGIPKKEQQLIFAPFYRLSSTKNGACDGSGLGLTIAKRFVEKLGGSIGVKSRVGKGCEFFIKLRTRKTEKNKIYQIGR